MEKETCEFCNKYPPKLNDFLCQNCQEYIDKMNEDMCNEIPKTTKETKKSK